MGVLICPRCGGDHVERRLTDSTRDDPDTEPRAETVCGTCGHRLTAAQTRAAREEGQAQAERRAAEAEGANHAV